MPQPPEPTAERVLIVEDLDEPRRWLAALLPTVLPGVRHIDTAASAAEAHALIAGHAYALSFIDWTLPDGTGEPLIRRLVAARPDARVVVTTIHDDDAYVFPALRAGATGYVLKTQPPEMVAAQIRRLEQGEPALSPSVATRILRYFQSLRQPLQRAAGPPALPGGGVGGGTGGAAEAAALDEEVLLTRREVEVLQLIAKGYSVPEAARLLGIASTTAGGYVRDIYRKLGISTRAEAAMEAARRGLVA